ncbi:MAG: hypothetical protein NTW69_00645 [Chloroflexi bacterium]|nr:hypothetical protein [Chloroflexota bacterium]
MAINNAPVISWKVWYSPKWNYAIIAVVALIVQGPILLMDGVYWDGWLIYTSLAEKNWNNIYSMFIEAGSPTTLYLHWFMGYFPNIILGYRVLAFISIACSSLLVYLIGNETKWVNSTENLWIALLSLAYPAVQVAFEIINVPSVVWLCLFYLACFLSFRAERAVGPGHYGLRASAVLLFLISFTVNSLLVFYFGFLLLLALFVRRLQSLSLRQTLMSFLPRYLDYILLPLLYWLIKETLFPRHGLYANYNQFTFSLLDMLLKLASFLNNGIYGQFKAALLEMLNQPALWLLALLGAWFGWRYFNEKAPTNGQSVSPYSLLAYGVLLMGFGIFPYVAAGLSPTLTGWSTRQSLLLALPVALIIVAIARLLFSEPHAELSLSGWISLTTLLLAFGLATVSNYIDWQARWVKDRSLMVNLEQLDGANEYSVYWVDDQYPVGGEDNYRFYEWSSIFKRVWGGETRIGLDQRDSTPQLLEHYKIYYTKDYNLSGFDPTGCQATLVIRQGKSVYTNIELVLRYFYYKFADQRLLSEFLVQVTQVGVWPFTSPLAVNCRLQ